MKLLPSWPCYKSGQNSKLNIHTFKSQVYLIPHWWASAELIFSWYIPSEFTFPSSSVLPHSNNVKSLRSLQSTTSHTSQHPDFDSLTSRTLTSPLHHLLVETPKSAKQNFWFCGKLPPQGVSKEGEKKRSQNASLPYISFLSPDI